MKSTQKNGATPKPCFSSPEKMLPGIGVDAVYH